MAARRKYLNCQQRYPAEMVHELRYRHLAEDLSELKERVRSLERTLARGVLLLVANLAGVVVTLAQQLARM